MRTTETFLPAPTKFFYSFPWASNQSLLCISISSWSLLALSPPSSDKVPGHRCRCTYYQEHSCAPCPPPPEVEHSLHISWKKDGQIVNYTAYLNDLAKQLEYSCSFPELTSLILENWIRMQRFQNHGEVQGNSEFEPLACLSWINFIIALE